MPQWHREAIGPYDARTQNLLVPENLAGPVRLGIAAAVADVVVVVADDVSSVHYARND